MQTKSLTQVLRESVDRPLMQFARWLGLEGYGRPQQVLALYKGDQKLLVHDFGPKCGILTFGPNKPKLESFKPWNERFDVVIPKLLSSGWVASKKRAPKVASTPQWTAVDLWTPGIASVSATEVRHAPVH
jgi:hypothetical protein